jgi:hypothetical protein
MYLETKAELEVQSHDSHAVAHNLIQVRLIVVDLEDFLLAEVLADVSGEHEASADRRVVGRDHALHEPASGTSHKII